MFRMRNRRRIIRKLSYYAPKSKLIYRICKMYVDNYQGVNNSDMEINGEVRFLNQFLSKRSKSIVFDVGANRGQWCRKVLSFDPSAQVHCFEPSRSTFQKLCSYPFPTNVVCNNIGLGSKTEEKPLCVGLLRTDQQDRSVQDPEHYGKIEQEPGRHPACLLARRTVYEQGPRGRGEGAGGLLLFLRTSA